ncbi:MAG: HAMP domain-containing histidine kinase [Lachnospiraceae bacterium]|nr:HAMP domain-containing histidine kinase [Lachnospiraceae bacterium]
MKNYIRMIILISLLLGVALLAFVFIANQTDAASFGVSGENIVTLNRIAAYAEEHKADLSSLDNAGFDADFVILDNENDLIYSHSQKTNDVSLEKAIQNRYPYRYLSENNKVWGTVILFDDGTDGYRVLFKKLTAALVVFYALLMIGVVCYGIYVHRNIIMPFQNLKDFAAKVAQGNLDESLKMDRNNMFGAFTESFDIMREELAETKSRELELQKKERELVASLSHDLKTPVTGIKLTAELMQMRLSVKTDTVLNTSETSGEGEKLPDGEITFTAEEIKQLNTDAEGILNKAGQIDTLVSDLFTSTLDDLGEFKVNLNDEKSIILEDIVKSFDDRGLAVVGDIPSVIINTDAKRMSQVIGNIMSNSYKYANTKIDIDFRLADNYLEMQISDHGPGVPAGELDLITNKFYRGKDWENSGKDGHGLGLYIAKSLMKRMNGDLIAESNGDGLAITLVIPLS